MADENASPAQVAPAAGPAKSAWLAKFGVLGCIVAVIGTECLVAYVFLPNPTDTEALAAALLQASAAASEPGASADADKSDHAKPEQAKAAHGGADKSKHGKSEKGGKDAEGDSGDVVEIDLGEFTVTASQPQSNSTLRIAFHLFGVIAAGQTEDFEARMKDCQHRYREQVLVTLRGAAVSDLTDAGLGLLKRTILEKTNALLGKPLVRAVIFSDFSFYEM